MSRKTRYLQLNDVMMLEYVMTNDINAKKVEDLYFTKLLDNHYCLFTPGKYEVTPNFNGKMSVINNAVYNTMNHLAVPMDRKDSDWYSFIDNSYEYSREYELESDKGREYQKYMLPIEENGNIIKTLDFETADIKYDRIMLYFVSGYDFSDTFGILCRIYVETDFTNAEKRIMPSYIDLCNFFFTKGSAYKMVKYLTEPIIFGSTVYDRYISIDIPSLHDICENTTSVNPNSILHIRKDAPIHIMMSSIEEGDYEMSKLVKNSSNTLRDIVNDSSDNKTNTLVNCEFSRTSTLNGAIPTQSLTSDRLGVYIALNDDYKCLEFCSTWQDLNGNIKPLDKNLVSLFNSTISLYDRSLIREQSAYEIDDDYTIEDSLSINNWVILHKIHISYLNENSEVLKEESYNMTQTFENDNADTIFYYRPFIVNTVLLQETNSIIIDYSSRLMNTRDMVQFLNEASLSITPDKINDYYYNNVYIADSSNNDLLSGITPYKIYNKITESKQEMNKTSSLVSKIKYVKVFYDSTDVVLEGSNGTYYSSGNIEITLSPVPKNYKFIIKYRKQDGVYDYMDLTDGYYKLYAKDNNNNDIVIEPTYSSNMNLLLGELEFGIDTKTINKLMNVDSEMRRMSIVAYNNDNSVSSLFDFTYNF